MDAKLAHLRHKSKRCGNFLHKPKSGIRPHITLSILCIDAESQCPNRVKVGSINSHVLFFLSMGLWLFSSFCFYAAHFASSFSRVARYTPLFTYKIFSPKIKNLKKRIYTTHLKHERIFSPRPTTNKPAHQSRRHKNNNHALLYKNCQKHDSSYCWQQYLFYADVNLTCTGMQPYLSYWYVTGTLNFNPDDISTVRSNQNVPWPSGRLVNHKTVLRALSSLVSA